MRRQEVSVDERLASAIAHWAPRFTANGVTISDFERITAGIDSWPQWCAAWSRVAGQYEELGRIALAEDRLLSAGEHLTRAATYFHFAKFVFVADLGQMREAHANAVRCADAALPHLRPPGRRVEVPFEGARLVGVLRIPDGPGPHPVVLMLSGLDSAKEELRSTEDTFLARGLATFSLDGPGQGEAEYDLPIRADWSAPAEAVVEILAQESLVDVSRLGVWGVSLGGYYSARVSAALRGRVTACVSLSGPFDFGASWDGLPALTRETFQVRSGSVGPSDARVAAQALSLEHHAADITAHVLIVSGRRDRLLDWRDVERMGDAVAGPAELLVLEEGNHGCANVVPLHRSHTADWLARRL